MGEVPKAHERQLHLAECGFEQLAALAQAIGDAGKQTCEGVDDEGSVSEPGWFGGEVDPRQLEQTVGVVGDEIPNVGVEELGPEACGLLLGARIRGRRGARRGAVAGRRTMHLASEVGWRTFVGGHGP
ncbi:hypothetical protein Afer_1679 [Acidimicrobium ferrooxidans DSM 10331]|uniref:Uncharacterized protein n=1 Tax=Acidimicrobium ferrooxidans (strain DSM 10331 / JCM 15462 / NBRC 103882 / ICP) TaxID=525909 RepID=C7M0T7_ACIFD|nr:hypothetical protein Afer_1679 [Acidimicrobium ferrooxidans DSM 10331]